jgi:hypothetical protein
MPASFSHFAASVKEETAFTVLAVARRLIAAGKDVIELEIGDSPFSACPNFDKPLPTISTGNTDSRPPPRTSWPGQEQRTSNSCSVKRF